MQTSTPNNDISKEIGHEIAKHPMKVLEDVHEGEGENGQPPLFIRDEFLDEELNRTEETVPAAARSVSADSAISSSNVSQNKSSKERLDGEREQAEDDDDTGGDESGDEAEDEEDGNDLKVSDISSSAKRPRTEPPDLPETCTVLRSEDGGIVYLVGTAHFSEESQEDVSKTISTLR